MKRGYVFLLVLFVIVKASYSQDAIPPGYLLKQDFPDTVRNLSLLKLNGERVSFASVLESFKGKKVVVDFWASWCRDCIVGLPKLEELKKQTGEEKIVYLSISVDKEDVKWKAAITRFDIKGEHYRVEIGWYNTLTNYIELDWIPRYLVIDENSRMIMPKAISADSRELQRSLKE